MFLQKSTRVFKSEKKKWVKEKEKEKKSKKVYKV